MTAVVAADAATFAALGEPSRLRIVDLLRGGPLSVGTITERLGLRQPQVSKHLRVLSDARVVEAEVRHRYRFYRLSPAGFEAVAHWVDSFEALWATRLDALGELLDTMDNQKEQHGHQADR